MIYELKQIKNIDGVEPCTHFELAYALNEEMAVGTYGFMVPATETEAESFMGLYGSATCEYADMIIPEIVKPTSANTIAEIKAYLDSMGTSYVGVTAKADLLALC